MQQQPGLSQLQASAFDRLGFMQKSMNLLPSNFQISCERGQAAAIQGRSLKQIVTKQVTTALVRLCFEARVEGITAGIVQVAKNKKMAVRQSAAKKFLNDPKDAVTDSLEGLVAATPHLQRLDGFPGVLESF